MFRRDVSLPCELETDRSVKELGITYNEGARRAAEMRRAAEKAYAEAGAQAVADRAKRHPRRAFEDEWKAGDVGFLLEISRQSKERSIARAVSVESTRACSED